MDPAEQRLRWAPQTETAGQAHPQRMEEVLQLQARDPLTSLKDPGAHLTPSSPPPTSTPATELFFAWAAAFLL